MAVQHSYPHIFSDKSMSGQLQLHRKCDSDAALEKGKNIRSERERGQGTALWCHVLRAVSGSLPCFCLWFLLVDTQALAHSLITDVNNGVSIGSNQNIQCFSATLGSKALQALLTTLSGCI